MADHENQQLDHVTSDGSSKAFDDLGFSPEHQKQIGRRIDRRLIAVLGCLYCVSLVDRSNLSVAYIAGMDKDLGLTTGYRYSLVTLTFYTTYVTFQPPSTVILRKIGPRLHLSGIVIAWGTLMVGLGFMTSWQQLAGLRAVLGILEAGMYPASVYLLSTWYIRYDMGKKYAFFYVLGAIAQAFSGILAYGLSKMDGVAGRAGWRWIFILEGTFTIVLGICAYWWVVGFPDGKPSFKFLTAKEMQYVLNKVDADRGDAYAEPFKFTKFIRPATDWKVWSYALITFNTITITSALSFFLPLILRDGMGFGVSEAQCLVAPPYLVAAIWMVVAGWFSDKKRLRGPVIVFNNVVAMVGLPLVGFAGPVGARYFGVFLLAAGTNANVPLALTYQANNIVGQWKRAFCSALLVGLGAVGGIAGSLIFRSQDSPEYYPGLYACFACCAFNLIIIAALSTQFFFDNRKAARGTKILQGEKGFRYTY